MKFFTEAKLTCGHEITFGNCGAIGNPGQMTHQKDNNIVEAYADFFARNELNPKRMLEIGVARGGSLAIWREMFKDCEIVGVDNNLGQVQPWTLDHYRENSQIQIHHFNLPDPNIAKLGQFDFIIDDGGHGKAAVYPTFEHCWKMLNPGGIYIVEDWIQYDESPMLMHFANMIVGDWHAPARRPNMPLSITTYRGFFAMRRDS